MNEWNIPGIPQKGWRCFGVEDMLAPSHRCQMCGNEEVRYVHLMQHPEHPDLAVGCVCAERMEDSYDGKRAEANLKNRNARRLTFRRNWRWSDRGNRHRKKDGHHIVIGGSEASGFWVSVDREFLAGRFASWERACDAAFDVVDRPRPVAAYRSQATSSGRN